MSLVFSRPLKRFKCSRPHNLGSRFPSGEILSLTKLHLCTAALMINILRSVRILSIWRSARACTISVTSKSKSSSKWLRSSCRFRVSQIRIMYVQKTVKSRCLSMSFQSEHWHEDRDWHVVFSLSQIGPQGLRWTHIKTKQSKQVVVVVIEF